MKKKYREYYKRKPNNEKYDIFYEFLTTILMWIVTVLVLSGMYILFNYIISAIGWSGMSTFFVDLLFWTIIITVPLSIILSIIMVIKSEIEKYLDYRKYVKTIEERNKS